MMKSYMKKLLVFMLLLVGGFTGEAWAVDITYHIVNKSGKELPMYKIVNHKSGDRLQISSPLKSPYIATENYKYFATPEDAASYNANPTEETLKAAITSFDELGGGTDVYIGYVYDGAFIPEGLPILEPVMGENAIRYHVLFSATNYYMYMEGQNNNNHKNPKANNTGDKTAKSLQFLFVSENCDPYDIKIITPYHSEGWLHGPAGAVNNDNRFLMDKHDETYDIERFFFNEIDNKFAICAVLAPYEKSTYDVQMAYLSYNGGNIRLSNVASIGNNQQISTEPLSLFHIVDKDGNICLSAYSPNLNPITIPAGLSSKVMPEEQYRYFTSKDDAQAYTANPTEENAQKAITVAEPNTEVYVGYKYVNNPQTMDLSGERWYYIRQNHLDAPTNTNYYYSYRGVASTANNNMNIQSMENIESNDNDGSVSRANAMFRFEGNDPYHVVIRNGYRYNNDNNPFSYIYLARVNNWQHYIYTSQTTSTPVMLLDYGDDYYTMAALNPYYTPSENYIGEQEYLLSWYSENANAGSQIYVANNNSKDQIWYYSDRNYPKLSFEPVQFKTTFHIIDKEGYEAISYTGMVDADMPLTDYRCIPEAIRSPYLEKETLKFYKTATPNGTSADGKVKYSLSDPIERTELLKGCVIYVTYTTDHLAEYPITLSNTDVANYNLIVNGQYVHEADRAIACDANEKVDPNYLWNLMGEDPYAVKIRNVSVSDQLLAFDTTSGNLSFGSGSSFILMGGKDGKYEIMAATGGNVNADINPYHIGYSAADGIKLYNAYAQGADEIQAQLEVYKPGATYHIIDKQHKEILSEYIGEQLLLGLPERLVSPLVTQYHYWKKDAFELDNDENPTTFILKDGQTEIQSVAEATVNRWTDIYVTYDVDETMLSTLAEIGKGNRKKYRLKFLNEQSKAVYPYANEEIELALLGDEQFEADNKSSAITRPNWGWYLESDLKDPYHIKIASAAQYESWGEGTRLYLQTSTTDGNTSATIDTPTDYMLLGTKGAYLLAFGDQEHIVKSLGKTSVGDGAFDITELILQPTLILLDRHGWEIMRKPLPAAIGKENVIEPDLDAINAYNSPMVKAYKFYRGAQKTKGYHKFEVSDPILVTGQTYTATSLTSLPTSYYSMGDNIYVTYDVKEEYENTYRAAIAEGKPATQYLIQLGDSYATAGDGATLSLTGMPDSKEIPNNILWYVKPNLDIDKEMDMTVKKRMIMFSTPITCRYRMWHTALTSRPMPLEHR